MNSRQNTTAGNNPKTGKINQREKAYLQFQQIITSGELKAGDTVSEVFFAEKFGVSRTPIREAIGQLVAEGLLEQKPNRGATVAQISRQDIIDLYELREALEVYAVAKVSRQTISPVNLERMQKLVAAIPVLHDELVKSGKETLDTKQMHHFTNCDLGFHTLLMHLAGNLRIVKMVNETRLLIKIFAIRRAGHTINELDSIYNYHQQILQSVINQEPEKAVRLLAEHIQTSMQERLGEYANWEWETALQVGISAYLA